MINGKAGAPGKAPIFRGIFPDNLSLRCSLKRAPAFRGLPPAFAELPPAFAELPLTFFRTAAHLLPNCRSRIAIT